MADVAKTTDQMRDEWSKAVEDAGVATEQEMRDADVPWPESGEDLTEYIQSLVDRPHDYGTCVYAMSMAAVAAFRHVAHKLGVSGFQASCADMDILRRTRRMEHGFRVVDYHDLLYPQYWDERSPIFEVALREDPERWRGEAVRLLTEGTGADTVRAHWEWIVDTCETQMEESDA